MREAQENGQVLYSVSEAVQKSGVPSHVLRYWEGELGLSIRRTSQGHRVYSEEDIETFLRVKDLKEKGIQLKAIRLLFQDTGEGARLSELFGRQPHEQAGGNAGKTEAQPDEEVEYEIIPKTETGTYRLFETMLRSLISEAVAGQNEKLEQELTDLIRDEIEELYIQLRQDMGEKEAAAAQMPGMAKSGHDSLLQRVKRFFGQGR